VVERAEGDFVTDKFGVVKFVSRSRLALKEQGF